MLFVEAYAPPNKKTAPHTITLAATIRGEAGEPIPLATQERSSTSPDTSGGYRFTARAPLTAFAPGNYVLEVEARSDLDDGAHAIRRIPFRIQ